MGSRYQSLADLEATSTEEEMNPLLSLSSLTIRKEPHKDLKKKGKAVLIGSQAKPSTGKKSANDGSKKFNLGLSVGKYLKGQARDSKAINLLNDHSTGGTKMVLDPQASLVVKKQSHSISNEQAPSNVSSGLQQEAQGPKESATDLSKLSSAMHDSLPSAEGNNRSLISGNSVSFFPLVLNSQHVVDADQVKVDPHFSLQKQAKHVVHFNPTFEENSFVNVEVKEGVLEARNHSAVVFKNKNILEPRAVELIASEIDGKSAMDLSRQKGERAEFSSTGRQ
ncbi:hypothetical protein Goshw_025443 [Gossypium schwendimanii]|uniref:Uncharacterized protein n=1 Tax=Gossypium schwendimanii TaxID=34291 RepID=A0A7J9KNI1_GOSSC|nr:hypothetical protein [Gossypium schwendimanii]